MLPEAVREEKHSEKRRLFARLLRGPTAEEYADLTKKAPKQAEVLHALETAGFHTVPFIDTDRDNVVSPHDVLLVINHLNAQQSGGAGAEGEGEGEAFAPASAHDEIFGEFGAIAPVASSIDGGIISLLADEQVRAKRNRQAE